MYVALGENRLPMGPNKLSFSLCSCYPSICMSSISFDMQWQPRSRGVFIAHLELTKQTPSTRGELAGMIWCKVKSLQRFLDFPFPDYQIKGSTHPWHPLEVQLPSQGCGSIRRKSAPQSPPHHHKPPAFASCSQKSCRGVRWIFPPGWRRYVYIIADPNIIYT